MITGQRLAHRTPRARFLNTAKAKCSTQGAMRLSKKERSVSVPQMAPGTAPRGARVCVPGATPHTPMADWKARSGKRITSLSDD